jgi:hypothetical protein
MIREAALSRMIDEQRDDTAIVVLRVEDVEVEKARSLGIPQEHRDLP